MSLQTVTKEGEVYGVRYAAKTKEELKEEKAEKDKERKNEEQKPASHCWVFCK
jgi:hypothetical protein